MPPHPQYIHVKAVDAVPDTHKGQPSVFLAGSIEMGKAELWQDSLAESLSDLPVNILNPRRPDWNSEWKQDPDFGKFKEQVDWELDHLDAVDVIALYFDPATKSPISLLELGLHAASGKLVVLCPEGFWRRGNVQIVCARHGVTMVKDKAELILEVRKRLEAKL